MSHSLNTLQSWFQTVITHPLGVRAGIVSVDAQNLIDLAANEAQRIVLPSQQLDSLERLQIYGSAYFGRLIECVRAQFPAVRSAVGHESFDAFAFGYLVQHPSNSYTLSLLSDRFDAFLSESRPPRVEASLDQPDFADFIVDLARLERTYSEIFDGPGPESVEPVFSFNTLTPDSFANSRLKFFDSVRLIKLRFPAHHFASAVRQETEAVIPQPRTTFLVVNRRDYIVRRFEVTSSQFRLLESLREGATVEQALAGLMDDDSVDHSTLNFDLKNWFQEWAVAPLFAGVITESSL